MLHRWVLGSLAAAFLLIGACSDDGDPSHDGSVAADRGPTDQSPTDQSPTDQGPTDQGQIAFDHPITLRHDTGLPVIKLRALSDIKTQVKFALDSDRLPFQVRSVDFVPVSAHTVIITIHSDLLAQPGPELARQVVTVGSGDLDDWLSVDFSAHNTQMTRGPIWVVQRYMPDLPAGTEVSYGAPDTTGNTTTLRPGYTPIESNFEPLLRVQGATSQPQPPSRPGNFGDPCGKALDCHSRYCSGGTCSKACTAHGDCGDGLACRTMAYGDKLCVTTCDSDTDCESTAQCLTDDRLFTAGFCALRGPRPNGTGCRDQYHTICTSGRCTACDADTGCQAPGTCMEKD